MSGDTGSGPPASEAGAAETDTREAPPAPATPEAPPAPAPHPDAFAPAPVITDDAPAGTLPPPLELSDLDEQGSLGALGGLPRWLVGLALFAAAAGWLTALSLAQATDETVAWPALEHALVVLTELDELIEVHAGALDEQLASGVESVTLPGYPLPVTAPAALIAGADGGVDRALLRDELLRRSAGEIYFRGPDVFSAAEDPPPPATLLSDTGSVRALINVLSSSRHEDATLLVWPAGIATLALAVVLFALGRGFGRFFAVGAAIALAALPVLLLGLAIRAALTLFDLGPAGALGEEYRAIVQQLAWLPMRNALIAGSAGLAVAVPAAVLGALFARSTRRPAPGPALPSEE